MTCYKVNNEAIDYHSINYDFTGSLNIENSQEIVEFQKDTNLRIWYNDQYRNFDTHWHNALEIILPVENYYDVFINNTPFHILPKELLIIPPGEMHKLQAPEKGIRFIYLFDLSILNSFKSFSGIYSLMFQPLYITEETYPKVYHDLYQLLTQMKNEYFSKNVYRELTIYSLLLSFFIKLGYNHINTRDLFPNVSIYKQKEYVRKFNSLLDYIDAHYMEDLNLNEIAASIGFSKYHFARLFKQYTGFTFCDYLNYRRLKMAEELLSKPDFSITEIALQSGFSSISTFNRLFKEQKKCTPREYRGKIQKKAFGFNI